MYILNNKFFSSEFSYPFHSEKQVIASSKLMLQKISRTITQLKTHFPHEPGLGSQTETFDDMFLSASSSHEENEGLS